MAVEVLAGSVVAHGGARVGVTGGDLDVAEVDAGVEHRGDEGVAEHVWVHPGIVTPAATARRLRRRVAAWRSMRVRPVEQDRARVRSARRGRWPGRPRAVAG